MSLQLQASIAFVAMFFALFTNNEADAQSTGYWHLPSTLPQYCGFGFGPGHHAPMVRTHGCQSLHIPRCVHTRECPTGGLAYCISFSSSTNSPNCHAELDALVRPHDADVDPNSNERLFSAPEEEPISDPLPIPSRESLNVN